MDNVDLENQLSKLVKVSQLAQSGLFLFIIGTIALAIYKKKKGGNYKLVIILGIGIIFFYLLIMSLITTSLVEPIYTLTE